MSWIDQVLYAVREAECPKKFIKWACLVALSAVAKRNVYLSRGGVYRLYPNIYVLIIADSGLRKSYAPLKSEELLAPLKYIRSIGGSSTIQRVVQLMGKPMQAVDGSMNAKDGSVVLISGEFTSLIKSDKQATTWLTELYDACYKTSWKYDTKNSGTDVLHNVCVTMFGATTKEHFNRYFDIHDISGGFLARTIILTTKELGKLNALIEDDETDDIDLSPYRAHLEAVAKLPPETKMHLTPKAKQCFKDWYYSFFKPENLKKLTDKTGFVMRSQDHVLKTAMLLSLADGLSLEITEEHIEESLEEIFSSARDIKEILFGRPDDEKSPMGLLYKKVLDVIMDSPGYTIERRKLLQRLWSQVNHDQLNSIAQTMEESGFVKTRMVGGKTFYDADKSVIDKFLEIKRGS